MAPKTRNGGKSKSKQPEKPLKPAKPSKPAKPAKNPVQVVGETQDCLMDKTSKYLHNFYAIHRKICLFYHLPLFP